MDLFEKIYGKDGIEDRVIDKYDILLYFGWSLDNLGLKNDFEQLYEHWKEKDE